MNPTIRVAIRISHPWPGILLLVCFLVGLTLSASVIAPGLRSGQQAHPAAVFLPATNGRHFYVTHESFATNTALTACSAGYHMASLWEILDVSDLNYDFDQPDAKTLLDSGNGPPSLWNGWVRTGNEASIQNTAGTGNCQNWSSFSSNEFGTVVRLSNTWVSAPGDILSWDASAVTCNTTAPVWCVGDFTEDLNQVFLPLINK